MTYYFALTVAIAYIVFDFLFKESRIVWKYLLSLGIAGGFLIVYFHPMILNPQYIYSTPDAKDLTILQSSYEEYLSKNGKAPSPEELAITFAATGNDLGESGYFSSPEHLAKRVSELYPYLAGENNYAVLLVRPLYKNTISMCVLCLGLIVLFFGYQYVKDPPQGAYIDKIMFLFLIFCSMEILHAWSFVKSVEWSSFYEIMNMGQVISIVVLLLIGLFFFLRLKFITSPNGEFYEQEIETSPAGITRWRDMLDEVILASFFRRDGLLGRFFVDQKRVT
jgi:hypothetical protein